jgi:hypothetical protein
MRCALFVVALITTFQGCATQQPYTFTLADFQRAEVLPYDSPPQVIYRIDDHRFITLEKYRDCNHGTTYYNDTKAGIRQVLGRAGIENFQGRLINADPTGRNIAIPSAGPPELACGDRGCTTSLIYSTDGGRTFAGVSYMNSFHPFQDSSDYTIIATPDKLFVVQSVSGDLRVRQFPLAPGIDLDRPYPPGLHSDGGWDSKKKLLPTDPLRSPSGQERFTCDASIKPTNPDAPLTRN